MYPGHWATVAPGKAAAVDTGTGAVRTYGELNDRSNRLAQLFWDKGLRRGDHVSIFMENHLAYFDVVWAALRSGSLPHDREPLPHRRKKPATSWTTPNRRS